MKPNLQTNFKYSLIIFEDLGLYSSKKTWIPLRSRKHQKISDAHMCFILLSCTITVELFKLYQSYNWYVFGLWLSIRIILAKSNKVRRVSTWEIQYMIEGLNLTIEGPFLTCFMVLGMIKNYLLEQFLYSATTLWNIHVWISILLFTTFAVLLL